MPTKRIVIAAGGTGGHLFPAQALALGLSKNGHDVLFAGAGLKRNPYLDRNRFPCVEIKSMSPYGGKKRLLKAPWVIGAGVMQSLQFLKKNHCDLVVGFGSFHTFPLLLAAQLKRVPIILFEPNGVMGRVNRFFAKKARCIAVQFKETAFCDAAKQRPVAYPFLEREPEGEGYGYFNLDPSKKTLLIVGGSQGAKRVNQLVLAMTDEMARFKEAWQLIHLVGAHDDPALYEEAYAKQGITACVKPFETRIALAWSIADLAICRSGAGTVAEQMHHAVPALFFPFPYATDDHQRRNAEVVEKLGGGVCLNEKKLDIDAFQAQLRRLFENRGTLQSMHLALKEHAENESPKSFVELIEEYLQTDAITAK